MKKSELVEAMAHRLGSTKAEANRLIDAFVATTTDVLKKGGHIVLPGFGSFSTARRAARTARNPRTGAPINVPAVRVAKFRAGKALKDAVQHS